MERATLSNQLRVAKCAGNRYNVLVAATLTLELDDAAEQTLQSLAESWHVLPEEAVKRAVSAAAQSLPPAKPSAALDAFRRLQTEVRLTAEQAEAWKESVADARR